MSRKKRPKVGIITRPIDQGMSGSGFHLKHLVQHILEINDRFDIVLIHYVKNKNEIYRSAKELIIPMNPLTASLKIQSEKFNLVHYSPLNILSPIWLRKTKRVATIHGGGGSQILLRHFYGKVELFRTKFIRPFYVKKMDYIFTVSNTSKNLITKNYGYDENKIIITYNAADDDFKVYKQKPDEIKKKYGIKGPYIFHLSRFSERKNPWTILNAFKILRDQQKDIKFVIGGNGWQNREILEFIRKNEIENNIIFTGFIPRDDVVKLLNLAEVFVFPSLFEGFGIPNLEAMACGCPVITSDAFAIPEIVGNAALILHNKKDPVELANTLITVLEDENLRKNLIAKGLERVKLYTWKESARTVLETYEKSLEN